MMCLTKGREQLEDRLSILVVFIFVCSTLVNLQLSFSAYRKVSLLNAACSYSYIVLWGVSAFVLRSRKGWVRTIFIVRWATIISFGVTMLMTRFNLDTKHVLLSVVSYVPFGVLFPVYGGIHTKLLQSYWFYLIPVGQAIISTVLFIIQIKHKEPTCS